MSNLVFFIWKSLPWDDWLPHNEIQFAIGGGKSNTHNYSFSVIGTTEKDKTDIPLRLS